MQSYNPHARSDVHIAVRYVGQLVCHSLSQFCAQIGARERLALIARQAERSGTRQPSNLHIPRHGQHACNQCPPVSITCLALDNELILFWRELAAPQFRVDRHPPGAAKPSFCTIQPHRQHIMRFNCNIIGSWILFHRNEALLLSLDGFATEHILRLRNHSAASSRRSHDEQTTFFSI